MDIIFKGRHTDVQEKFRERATAKLSRIGKLDQKAIRIDVEVSAERNPRQSDRRERVELTITSRGPAIRAEAAGQDRYAALDMALAKLESRLRRAGDRRKARRSAAASRADQPATEQSAVSGAAFGETAAQPPADQVPAPRAAMVNRPARGAAGSWSASDEDDLAPVADDVVQIEMEGDGPLVVREKFHLARPMTIDQALFEMELVGHDFFLFRDIQGGLASVVYRRFGYQYGVIRLVEEAAEPADGEPRRTAVRAPRGTLANGQAKNGAQLRLG